jgi:hypothetical protein
VLIFNLAVTFWIGESFLGLVGIMIYTPVTVLLFLRILNRLPAPSIISAPRAALEETCADWHKRVY